MNISIPYKLNNEDWNRRSDIEFDIPYDDERNEVLDKFLAFVELYPKSRINVCFKGQVNTKHLSVMNKVSDNIYVRVKAKDFPAVKELKEKEYKFFFDSELAAYNYSTLDSFVSLGTTDVYIADDLCYDLEKVSEFCKEHNTHLRTILNKVPMTTPDRGSHPKTVFWRPNDIDYLKQYFNTFEFDCGEPYNWTKHNAMYRTYFFKKDWLGDITELVDGYYLPLFNRSTPEDYCYYRMNCGLKCDKGRTCNKCDNLYELAEKMYEKGIVRKKDKKIFRNTIRMSKEQYDTINYKLSSLGKNEPLSGAIHDALDLLGIPYRWIQAEERAELDPSVIENGVDSE